MNNPNKNIVACSHCFHDIGLRHEAEKVGTIDKSVCPICGSTKGTKLDIEQLEEACYNYFNIGSYIRTEFGGSNYLSVGNFADDNIEGYTALKKDIKFLSDNFNIGVFHYGPQMWKVGMNEWIEALNSKDYKKRKKAIEEIAGRCYTKKLGSDKRFYRIRTNLKSDSINPTSYDAPPLQNYKDGRMNLKNNVVFYGAFNVETCIHETRVAIDDEIYVATLHPAKDLRFLDFCRIKSSKTESTDFEFLSTAINQLFLAGKQSYNITRQLSRYAYENGYDGIIYPSFFNSVRDKKFRNLVIFGRPIKEKKVIVTSIDRINLNTVKYNYTFGPVTEE